MPAQKPFLLTQPQFFKCFWRPGPCAWCSGLWAASTKPGGRRLGSGSTALELSLAGYVPGGPPREGVPDTGDNMCKGMEVGRAWHVLAKSKARGWSHRTNQWEGWRKGGTERRLERAGPGH